MSYGGAMTDQERGQQARGHEQKAVKNRKKNERLVSPTSLDFGRCSSKPKKAFCDCEKE